MPASPFLDSLRQHMLAHHYGRRTVETYLYWVLYFIRFQNKRHPRELGSDEVLAFLSFLANERKVPVATQKQALNALAYLYNKYLGKPLGTLGYFNKASQPRKLPVVLTRSEVGSLLGKLSGSTWLLASMIYASGLRRIEAVSLRVNNVDFDHGLVRVWGGKGNKHRVVTLAPELCPYLRNQISKVGALLKEDLLNPEYCGVWLPNALARKHPTANRSLGWHYLFPSSSFSYEPGTRNLRRHHVDESYINKLLKRAASECGFTKMSPATRCATRLPRICWNQARTFALCRSNWVTRTSKRQKYIHTY